MYFNGSRDNIYFGAIFNNFRNLSAHYPCSKVRPAHTTGVRIVLLIYALPIFGIFAVFGNLASAIVFTRRKMRAPLNLFLVALAIVNIITLITAFLIYSIEVMIDVYEVEWLFLMWIEYIPGVYGLSHLSVTLAAHLTVASTVMNFYATVTKHLIFRRQVLWTIGGTLIASTLIIFPKFKEIDIKTFPRCELTLDRYELTQSTFMSKWGYKVVYSLYLNNLLALWLPFSIIVSLNLLLLFKHRVKARSVVLRYEGHTISTSTRRKRSLFRQHLSTKVKESQVILALVVVMFLICSAPSCVLQVFETIEAPFLYDPVLYSSLRDAVNLLTIVDASVNFLFYPIISPGYRSTMIRLLRARKQRTSDGLRRRPNLRAKAPSRDITLPDASNRQSYSKEVVFNDLSPSQITIYV